MPHPMAMILTTAFIAITALALPNAPPVVGVTVPPAPAPDGVETGKDFDDGLVFTLYKGVECHGEPAIVYRGQYGRWEALEMQSYNLSRSLELNEELDFYSGIGADGKVNYTVDNSRSGHFSDSCFQFDRRAGVNATTSDAGKHPKMHGRNEGCHTLVHNEWCANLWLDTYDLDGA